MSEERELQEAEVVVDGGRGAVGTDELVGERGFTAFGLSEAVLEAVAKMGFVEATPIQLKALPLVLAGKDLLGQAQTGTGKTAAFGIAIAERLAADAPAVEALVLCPTRELAMQVAEEVHEICLYAGHKVLPVYGGQRIDRQISALRKGVQVVVGTPGRILDHLGRGTLSLKGVRVLVLDEADMMLDMGFLPDIRRIIRQCPEDRQTLLFSATLPEEVIRIARDYMRDPERVSVVPETLTLEETEQIFYEIPEDDKLDALMRLLDAEKEGSSVMIFCRTRRNVDKLTRKLKAQGYDVEGLHGDLTQQQRDRIMTDFRQQKFPYLIATDVASRGLDISHVTHVVNYHIPQDPEAYVHRIGRTGRMGRTGVAITFVTPAEYWDLLRIQEFSMAQIEPGQLPPAAEEREGRRRGHRPSRARAVEARPADGAPVEAPAPYPDEAETAAALEPAAEAEPSVASEGLGGGEARPPVVVWEGDLGVVADAVPSESPVEAPAPDFPEEIIELTPAGREALSSLAGPPEVMEPAEAPAETAPEPAEERPAEVGHEIEAGPEVEEEKVETTEAERRQRRYAEKDARRRIEWTPAEEAVREASRLEHDELVDALFQEASSAEAAQGAVGEEPEVEAERDRLREERRAEVAERLREAEAAVAAGLPREEPSAAAPEGPETRLLEPEDEARIQWALTLLRRVQSGLSGLDERQLRDYLAVVDRLVVDTDVRLLSAALLHELADQEGVPAVKKEPGEMARLFVSIGRRSRISKDQLQQLVRETAGISEADIGRIDLLHNFAFIEVRKAVAGDVIDRMHEMMFKGREISVAPAKPTNKGSGPADE